MKRFPIIEWDSLWMALVIHELPTEVGSQLFQIMKDLEYTDDEMHTVARILFSYANYAGACEATIQRGYAKMTEDEKWNRIKAIWHHPDLKTMSKKRHIASMSLRQSFALPDALIRTTNRLESPPVNRQGYIWPYQATA